MSEDLKINGDGSVKLTQHSDLSLDLKRAKIARDEQSGKLQNFHHAFDIDLNLVTLWITEGKLSGPDAMSAINDQEQLQRIIKLYQSRDFRGLMFTDRRI